MCGLAGHLGPAPLPPPRITTALRALAHRGPDHAAHRHWTNHLGRSTELLHTRLAIIDLDVRAAQPLRVGSRWIACNGEVYNYRELRTELEASGERFETASDTEVLLRAVTRIGWAVLDRCEGMWAFAVYDEADGSLTLCRDRFGEKPLYLYRDGDTLYFASEVKAIAALAGQRLAPNVGHLTRYLVNGYKALGKTQDTFFHGVHELPPATLLRIEPDGREHVARYWEPRFAPDPHLSYADVVAGTRARLVKAVELRLRADVPLAFCLSGGIDSNALVGIARTVFDYDVHGFTVVNSDARYDEGELAAIAAKHHGIRHTEILLDSRGFLPRLRALVRQHNAPVYTITAYAHWLLMEAIAAEDYRIAVSGTGADELFTGYYDHHLAYLYEVRRDPRLYPRAVEAWRARIQPLVRNPYLMNPDLFRQDPACRDHIFLDAGRFAAALWRPWREPFTEHRFTDDLLRNRMLNEVFHETVPTILHDDDLNAMAFSLENRAPFLDRALFEFAFRIPTPFLVRRGLAKAVLRDAVRGLVPDQVLDNPRKVGFNAPIQALLDVADPDVRAQVLDRSAIFEHVRRDRIEALLAKSSLPNSDSKFVFSVLSAKFFLEEFA